jgi:hypothetical protein
LAEIAPQQVAHKQQILHDQRPVEAELMMHRGNVGLAGAGFDQQRGGVAGHADEKENGQGQHEERQQRVA